ncbi:type II and III secretion system protein [bacterium]|nr:type II and III secretion system protein [bacterium]
MNILHFRPGTLLISIVILLLNVQTLSGQEKIPREFVPVEGAITLNKGLPFPAAVQTLNEISTRLEKKIIIDATKQTKNIGIDIRNLNWRDALELITKVNNLTIKEFENYIEVTYPEAVTVQGEKEIEKEVNILTREINISALFFDADRQRLREVGINWNAVKTFDNGKSILDGSLNTVGEKSAGDIFTLDLSSVSGDDEISALLKSLESDNVGEIIANPQITVMDGEVGRIQIGQDFSVKQRDFAGNVTDQFFSSGIILTVKPKIFAEDDIDFVLLEVTTERSSAIPSAVSTVINKTAANTSVLLYNGEEVAIAGLYSTSDQNSRSGIPVLKDIPKWFLGLGYLFGYDRKEKVKRELVILLKAEIVPNIKERLASKIEGENVLMNKRAELKKQVESKIQSMAK